MLIRTAALRAFDEPRLEAGGAGVVGRDRHVRVAGGLLVREHQQRADALLDRQEAFGADKADIDMAAGDRGAGGPAAVIGHDAHARAVDAVRPAEQREVDEVGRGRLDADREAARVALQALDHLGHREGRLVRRAGHQCRVARRQVDHPEIVRRVAGIARKDRDRDEGCRGVHHHHVAVVRLLQEEGVAEHRAAAGAVHHRHGLADVLLHEGRHGARQAVVVAAGRKGDEQRDGPLREALRARGGGSEDKARGKQRAAAQHGGCGRGHSCRLPFGRPWLSRRAARLARRRAASRPRTGCPA